MYSLLLLDAPDKERSRIGSTSDAKILKTILQRFSTLTLVNKCIVAFNKISYECNKMHWNKLPGTLIFKIFRGSTRFPCAGGGALLLHIIPQDRRYRDEIVLRLLYNFLLLHFFQLENPVDNFSLRSQQMVPNYCILPNILNSVSERFGPNFE